LNNEITGNNIDNTKLVENDDNQNMIDLENQISKLKSENKTLKDKLLRSYADYQNFRNRTEDNNRKQTEQIKYELFFSLIDQIDQLFIINSHWNSEESGNNKIIKNYLENLQNQLEKFGVKKIETIGQTLDLNIHEVVKNNDTTREESDNSEGDIEDYMITSEIRSGYIFNDRILRPALVEVRKK
jgi:molecular chaperone GrpE